MKFFPSKRIIMRYTILRLAVVVLAFQGLAVAQQTAGAPPQIKNSITIDSTTLARDTPALVTITIENLSGQELEISGTGFNRMSSSEKFAGFAIL
jgi:hypothetical protein